MKSGDSKSRRVLKKAFLGKFLFCYWPLLPLSKTRYSINKYAFPQSINRIKDIQYNTYLNNIYMEHHKNLKQFQIYFITKLTEIHKSPTTKTCNRKAP